METHTHTDRHTDTQNDYRNPRCACAPRVNESGCLLCRIMRAAPKVAHSKTRSPAAAPIKVLRHPTVSARPKTLKSWDEGSMQQAMDAVRDRRCTIREAAVTYEVPKSTLGDRISGRVQMGAKSGPPTYLTPHEERELVDFLIGCAQIGFARTRRQVMSLVRAAMVKKGREDAPITSGWWDSFM